MMERFEAYTLGATLYMPVLHPRVVDILHGRMPAPSLSVVLCLEDALAETDVSDGLSRLDQILQELPDELPVRAFLRPRNFEMAREICAQASGTAIDGIVAPKILPDALPGWLEAAREAQLTVMPTLESATFFDPAKIVAIRDVLDAHREDAGRLAAIRLGGNDLLSSMGLRRTRGMTAWDGPLAWVLSMASSILTSAGHPVAAPVFDIIDDLETLQREVAKDVAAGFISKTIIHPAQAGIVEGAFQVSPEELDQARAILDAQARAVFQLGGVMCEPATHTAWAERTITRARIFGTKIHEVPNLDLDRVASG
jgi:citrate lyase beta subunit